MKSALEELEDDFAPNHYSSRHVPALGLTRREISDANRKSENKRKLADRIGNQKTKWEDMTFYLRPSQKVIMAATPYVLIEDTADSAFRFCWFRDEGIARPGYVADFRKDSLIYVAGFETKDRAIAYAEKEGWIEL